MALFLPQRWREQPQGRVELDLGNEYGPLAEFVVLGSGGNRVVDLVKNELCSSTDSKRSAVANGLGIPLSTDGASFKAATYRAELATTKAISVVVAVSRGDIAGGFIRPLRQSNGGGYGWSFDIEMYGAASTDNRIRFGGSWNGAGVLCDYNVVPWRVTDAFRFIVVTAAIGGTGTTYSNNLWVGGRKIATDVSTNRDPGTDTAGRLYSYLTNTSGSRPSSVGLAAAFRGVLPPAVAQELSENPWQMFKARRPVIFSLPTSGGAAVLEGAATAGATASGGLTTAIPVAGAATGGASASGGLTTAIKLAGASVSATTSSGALSAAIQFDGSAAAAGLAGGELTIQIRLRADALAGAVSAAGLTTAIEMAAAAMGGAQASGELMGNAADLEGNALAAALAEGALTIQIRLNGASVAGALAAAALSTGISFAGAAQIASLASGSVTTQVRLVADAVGAALASGDLSGAAALAGAAIAGALADGDLATAIRLAGAALGGADSTGALTTQPSALAADAQAIVISDGGLTTGIPLQGAAASVVQAIGALDVAITMRADAFGAAMASGVLSAQIRLDAAAVAGALAGADLMGGNAAVPPVERTLVVQAMSRRLVVPGQLRTLALPGMSRVLPISAP